LAALFLLGLALRLWGLGWEAPAPGSGLVEDWGWRVIDHLDWSQPFQPGLWPQAFFSLAALVQGAASLLAGGLALLLGETRFLAELALDARLAGRLSAALLGAAQIPLAYLLGRRCFDSVATGLLAAVLVAVGPLLVAQSHYLSPMTALGFLLLLAAWLSWLVMESPRPGVMAGLGLVLGLAVTIHPLGAGVLPVGLTAAGMAAVTARAPASRRWLLWPLCLAAGMVLGLALGAPALWLQGVETVRLGWTEAGLAPLAGDWATHIRERLALQGKLLVGLEGLPLAVLWLAGVAVMVKRGQKRRLVVALAPLPLMVLGWLPLGSSAQAWLAAWLPGLAAVAAWPLVLLCRRLPAFAWQVAAVAALLVLIAGLGVWRSAGVGYLFWQEGTTAAARFWLGANLPPGAPLLVGPGAPLDLFPGSRVWRPGEQRRTAYLVVRHGPGAAGSGPSGEELARRQPLKRFDLRGGWIGGSWGLWNAFPESVSPGLSIYAPEPRREILQPLALARPMVGLERPYAVVYLGENSYSRDAGGGLLAGPGRRARRVLRHEGPLAELGLRLCNLGSGLARAELTRGLWPRSLLTLYPGQQLDLTLPARDWPPMTAGLYPLGVELKQGGPLWVRLIADPLLLGKQALEAGRWAAAEKWMARAVEGQEGFEALAMWAGALARQGKLSQASRVLSRLDGRVVSEYGALAAADPGADWDRRLSQLTGYHLGLLRRATSRTYRVEGPLCLSNGKPVSLAGEGFTGSFRRPARTAEGVLTLRLSAPWPQGDWRAELELKASEADDPRQVLAQAEIWARGGAGGANLAARRSITAGDLAGGAVSLPFHLDTDGSRLELRLEFASPQALRLEQVRVAADLRVHMRGVMRWYYGAWGLVSLENGQYQAAVEAFQNLLKLSPGFRAAYLPLAKALVEVGKLEPAYSVVRRAEEAYGSFPDQLAEVAALYKALRKEEDLSRVEKSLGHMRPSLRRVSRFADGLTLLGYDLPKAQVKPGGKLAVNFYWRAWQKVPLDYTVFLHLRGPGRTLNYDHHLDHGRMAMTALRPGQVVREDFTLEIPSDAPPGKYEVVLGLWDPNLAPEAVEVVQGEDAGRRDVTLATVEVR
jgi:tetratricopeptide (TPR) repeat protein/4-amino-4-deoxy-L-arabinose transferase-like glycosyltransferase